MNNNELHYLQYETLELLELVKNLISEDCFGDDEKYEDLRLNLEYLRGNCKDLHEEMKRRQT